MQQSKLTNLQLELLKLYSFNLNDEQLNSIKLLLANFFANQATTLFDSFLDDRLIDSEILDKWSNENLRTSY